MVINEILYVFCECVCFDILDLLNSVTLVIPLLVLNLDHIVSGVE